MDFWDCWALRASIMCMNSCHISGPDFCEKWVVALGRMYFSCSAGSVSFLAPGPNRWNKMWKLPSWNKTQCRATQLHKFAWRIHDIKLMVGNWLTIICFDWHHPNNGCYYCICKIQQHTGSSSLWSWAFIHSVDWNIVLLPRYISIDGEAHHRCLCHTAI